MLAAEDVPGHSKEPLSEDELLQRRMGNIDKLYELYQVGKGGQAKQLPTPLVPWSSLTGA